MDDLPNEVMLMCMPHGCAVALACVCRRWRDILGALRPLELVSESARGGRISILVWLCEVAPMGWSPDSIHAALRVAIVSGHEGALKALLDGPALRSPVPALDARLPALAAAYGGLDVVETLCSAGCPCDDWTCMVLGATGSADDVERFVIRRLKLFRYDFKASFLGALILGRTDVLRVFYLRCGPLVWNNYLAIFAPPNAVEWMDKRFARAPVKGSIVTARARSLIKRYPDLMHTSQRHKVVKRILKMQQRAHETRAAFFFEGLSVG